MKVGIIGCGNIGTELALFIDKNKDFSLGYLCDINKNNIDNLIKKLKNSNPEIASFEDLLNNSDLIIESANKDVVKELIKKISEGNFLNKKILMMSTGGLIENLSLLKRIKNSEIYLPSGAIAGLDAIKAVSGKIKSLTLTTTKSPKGLENAPYIIKNSIDLLNIKGKKTIFEGKMEDAIKGFPKNINVAATLFLASKFDGIKVRIVADSDAKTNTHEIFCEGDFGKLMLKAENLPSRNPKTSYLAVLSAMRVLRNIKENIKIGT